jgi:hypothetical protein
LLIRSGVKVNVSHGRSPFLIVCANAKVDARLDAASRVAMAQPLLKGELEGTSHGHSPIYAAVTSG